MPTASIKNELSRLLRGSIFCEKRGTYGIVLMVDHGQNVSPRYIAYKTIEAEDSTLKEEKLRNFIREARQWFKVKGHQLILIPFYINFFKGRPLICMPYCETDLEGYLERHPQVSLIEGLVLSAQILKGLMVAREKGIEAHQDLKPGNILLKDLGKNFSHEGLDPSIRRQVKLADFGLANAYKEIGKPQGSFPYMAPEQYTPEEYVGFSPDIFAVGVIMAEMLSGKHPCGKQTRQAWRDWNRKKWQLWAKGNNREISLDYENAKPIEEIIRQMLDAKPQARPNVQKAFENVMDVLSQLHKPTWKQLKLLLEYYDTLAEYSTDYDRLNSLIKLSRLQEISDLIVDELWEEIDNTKRVIDNEQKVLYFAELCYQTGLLLDKRGDPSDREKVKQLGTMIIAEMSRWKGKIKAEHKHPKLTFKGTTLFEFPYDDYAEFDDQKTEEQHVNYGQKLLSLGKKEEVRP